MSNSPSPLLTKRDALLAINLDSDDFILALKLLADRYAAVDLTENGDALQNIMSKDIEANHAQFLAAYDLLLAVIPRVN